MQPLLNIAVTAARQAGELILRHAEQVDRLKLLPKGEGDYACEVDLKAEQAIIAAIHKAYPDHGIQAEESGHFQSDAETVWIIDPLDGTKNYIHGFPFYAVSIAVRVKSRIEHAVVYDPLRHECFSASRGSGARLNNQRIRVSKEVKMANAMLSAGLPVRHKALSERYMHAYERLVGQYSATRVTGSAALDLAYVASGRLDGFWGFSMKPWDIAAGVLLVQEAGGLISNLQGGELQLVEGNVIAAPPKIFKVMLKSLQACE
ncbi:MAG: inositol monophosphatase [Gammaproteobacteria bacterium]|nr:inositol monophosphatase [Gammaproteobacteria bacterium]